MKIIYKLTPKDLRTALKRTLIGAIENTSYDLYHNSDLHIIEQIPDILTVEVRSGDIENSPL